MIELKEDVREECTRFGEVVNVTVYPDHPNGIVTVKFKQDSATEQCITVRFNELRL